MLEHKLWRTLLCRPSSWQEETQELRSGDARQLRSFYSSRFWPREPCHHIPREAGTPQSHQRNVGPGHQFLVPVFFQIKEETPLNVIDL